MLKYSFISLVDIGVVIVLVIDSIILAAQAFVHVACEPVRFFFVLFVVCFCFLLIFFFSTSQKHHLYFAECVFLSVCSFEKAIGAASAQSSATMLNCRAALAHAGNSQQS